MVPYQGVANATPMLGWPACTGVKTPAYHHLAANAALAKITPILASFAIPLIPQSS